MWAMIIRDEGGEDSLHMLTDVTGLLNDPGCYGVDRFEDTAFLASNPNPKDWPSGVAVLVRMSVVVPEPVTTAYRLRRS